MVRRISYRGFTITETTVQTAAGPAATYAAEGFRRSSSLWEMRVQANARLFRRATGIYDFPLEERYAAADTDRDGALSWSEVRSFQRALTRAFRYIANGTALRPDRFLRQGGGDCEDWALVTCGLLRFWGYEAYVGSIGDPSGMSGHAVCLVPQQERPVGMTYFELRGFYTSSGAALPDGYYIPIDYEHVGRLSSAVESGWVLKRVYEPESLYGMTI